MRAGEFTEIPMVETREMARLLKRLVWFSIAALVVVGSTVAVWYKVEAGAQETFFAKREISRLARSAAALATDRETGIRGYLLTHDQTSLVPEVVGRAQLPHKLDSLTRLTAADSAHASRIRNVGVKVREWEDRFAEPALRGEIASESMMAGKPLFDQVRSAFEDLVAVTEGQVRREADQVRNRRLLGAAIVLAELLALLGIVLFVIRGRLMKQAGELEHQQELLEQQAVELEMQVADMEAGNQALAEREERLRESEERYRYVARATNDAVYEWDVGTQRFDWNEGMTTLFGYPAEEIEDSPNWITSLVHDEDVQVITDTFAAALNEGASQWAHDYRLRRRDGKYANVQGRAYILRDKSGNPTRVIGAITDRTQEQSLEGQLRQAQKMEAIGRLAGGIAHDFNNILTVIRMSSEFLLSEIPESEETHQDAQEIMKAAERASRLTRQLLAFSRHQVLNPTQLSLNDIVTGMEGMVRRVVPENIEIITELEPQPFSIKADAGQMEQVLLNLVINAADAMPNGGRLAIRTTNAIVDASFSATHLDVPAGEYVCATVSDSGFGMDQQTLARIFDPFFTTKGVGKGTGLGLATVHGIVTQSGGRIWVYSEPSMGTTFKIYLPRVDAVAEVASTPILTEEMAPPTETILLVEDEAPTRDAVQRTLARAGYKVIEASNGAEALEAAETHRGDIDVVLTDSMMPEMGGAELARHLKQTRPDIRIVMMSGYTEDVAGVGSGLEDLFFIEKPFTRADLMLVLRSALKG